MWSCCPASSTLTRSGPSPKFHDFGTHTTKRERQRDNSIARTPHVQESQTSHKRHEYSKTEYKIVPSFERAGEQLNLSTTNFVNSVEK
ncbi:hypothetical protein CEXT_249151 [Caerostris extrusa]|uniref:Uncharacterized protein n=1 Tax=Caerostris extrusa TaxID=172846 RepID=A0AAV4VEB4_CAEEX|nr:hypothetical protein CEXT_249151 [Caerostris extrusa]